MRPVEAIWMLRDGLAVAKEHATPCANNENLPDEVAVGYTQCKSRLACSCSATHGTVQQHYRHSKAWGNGSYSVQGMSCLQLLRNLRHSVTTLEILGEWGTGARSEDEAALELKTDRMWMEGRAQQKRLSALQVCFTAIVMLL